MMNLTWKFLVGLSWKRVKLGKCKTMSIPLGHSPQGGTS